MSLMRKYFAGEKKEEVSLEITKTPTAVLVKGEKHFDIYEDGNGNIRAQHKDGKWLDSRENLTSFYEFAKKFDTMDECHNYAQHYIQSRQLRKVGTIEFIPSPKEKYND